MHGQVRPGPLRQASQRGSGADGRAWTPPPGDSLARRGTSAKRGGGGPHRPGPVARLPFPPSPLRIGGEGVHRANLRGSAQMRPVPMTGWPRRQARPSCPAAARHRAWLHARPSSEHRRRLLCHPRPTPAPATSARARTGAHLDTACGPAPPKCCRLPAGSSPRLARPTCGQGCRRSSAPAAGFGRRPTGAQPRPGRRLVREAWPTRGSAGWKPTAPWTGPGLSGTR